MGGCFSSRKQAYRSYEHQNDPSYRYTANHSYGQQQQQQQYTSTQSDQYPNQFSYQQQGALSSDGIGPIGWVGETSGY